MKKFKEIISYALIIVLVLCVRAFIVTPIRVDGESMSPTLDTGEILLLKKYDKSIERFDIVVVNYNGTKIIKRVIGLPGESVEYKGGNLYINGEEVIEDFITVSTADFNLNKLDFETIPNGYYFVVGDNRNNSTDSRILGLISYDEILGTVDFSLFPFRTFGKIE